MTFQDCFQQVQNGLSYADASAVSEPARIQVNVTGEDGGVFYVEIKDGNLTVEPQEHHDRDVELTISNKDFQRFLEGRLDPLAALATGKLKVQGAIAKAMLLTKLFK